MTDCDGLVGPLVRIVGLSRMRIFGLPEKGSRGEGVVMVSLIRSLDVSLREAGVSKMLKSLVGTIEIVEADGLCLKAGTRNPDLELLRPAKFPVLQIGGNLCGKLTSALRQYPSGTFRGAGSLPSLRTYRGRVLC
jgi:hypothetical protein